MMLQPDNGPTDRRDSPTPNILTSLRLIQLMPVSESARTVYAGIMYTDQPLRLVRTQI